ncbi:hypothetical protein DVH24_031046 [Malus domestica]|uniref:Uncharacterized protein n=1 Tax=Malus domestica TaxID=3750 RepID=A0A498HIF6_MALDO|nr:hypothetical protein DVH24_031046 [Malus domestica]
MEVWEEELEPVSPNGHYFNSSVLSISVLGVLEFEIPIEDSQTLSLLENVFLPINPRFSSIMRPLGDGGTTPGATPLVFWAGWTKRTKKTKALWRQFDF